MTRLQRVFYRLGAWRLQRFRRWVGGPWRERYIEPTVHSSECPRLRWEPCELSPLGNPLGVVYRSELWPLPLPIARVTRALSERTPCAPECRCEHCGYPWRGCACGATPETGADLDCDREPLGIQYGCRAVRDRRNV